MIKTRSIYCSRKQASTHENRISLFLTTLVVLNDQPANNIGSVNLVSDLFFAFICVLGIIAGVAPRYCSFSLRGERHGEGVSGHHPDCGSFGGHTVFFGGSQYCAGCSGLVIGAILSLVGLVTGYYPFDLQIGFWFGSILVFVGLAQHFIDLGIGWVHLWLNLGFVVGDWLIYASIKAMSLSFTVSIYFLAVSIWWIHARIRASQWTHVAVCTDCTEYCMLRFE